MYSSLSRTFNAYISSPPITLLAVPTPDMALFSPVDDAKRHLVRWRELAVPGALLALAVNVITQGLCIRGVNRLTSVSWQARNGSSHQRVSSTTVNLILTVRKAVSLALSVWYYGSGWSWGLIVGGAMVLGELMNVGRS
jgi:UDP-xylose/UDP-N-acetylglucosamine transporter B4